MENYYLYFPKLRKASNAFRRKIKGLGLYRLQKSIWVSPYDCISELNSCSYFESRLKTAFIILKLKNCQKKLISKIL